MSVDDRQPSINAKEKAARKPAQPVLHNAKKLHEAEENQWIAIPVETA